MSHHHLADHATAALRACGASAAWLGCGAAIGLVGVDSNRPSTGAGFAFGLPKQFVAAH